MMWHNSVDAIDAAIKFLGLNKIGKAVQDDKAYYFTGCGDDGEGIRGACCCSVDKRTLECKVRLYDDPCWKTEKKEFVFPEERKDVYAENWEGLGVR